MRKLKKVICNIKSLCITKVEREILQFCCFKTGITTTTIIIHSEGLDRGSVIKEAETGPRHQHSAAHSHLKL